MDVGDVVGQFTAQDQDGRPVTLGELVGSGPLVLYFFVKAMTPG
jgi:peroxiredoxin